MVRLSSPCPGERNPDTLSQSKGVEMWIILFLIILLVAIGLLVFVHIRDKRYLSKPVREVLGEELKEEIEKERNEFAQHQEKFQKALEKAKAKSPQP